MSVDKLNRAPGYEECPGCQPVAEGRRCEPRNVSFCLVAQATQPGWAAGACEGCLLLLAEKPCARGDARVCPVAWSRNR